MEGTTETARRGWGHPGARLSLAVGLVGLLIGAAVVLRYLPGAEWNPTEFIALGEASTPTLEFASERLDDVVTRPALGHDGRFFFVQANDPLHLEPATHAANLDRPSYRAQRMLYPMIAGGFGLLPPIGVAWGMLIVNVIALGVGTWGTAAFARGAGWSPWWGLAFALNIGIISEFSIGGAGVVGFAAAMWGLVAVQRERNGWAAVAFTAAVLSREALLIVVVGAALWYWFRYRRVRWSWLLTPPIAALAWAGYLRLRLQGIESDEASIQEIGFPFVGLAQAAETWLERPLSLAAGAAIVGILIVFTIRAFRSDRLLVWSVVGFVPLAMVFTRQVWLSYFDISRAIAPLLTAWVIVTFARHKAAAEPAEDAGVIG